MKKLDDIPKKQPFNVPDDYFDRLPGKIQVRVHARETNSPIRSGLTRLALASLIVAAVAFVWIWKSPGTSSSDSPEAILAGLETSDLVAYLNESDVTTDELLDELRLSDDDAAQIETTVFSLELDDSDLNLLMNEID